MKLSQHVYVGFVLFVISQTRCTQNLLLCVTEDMIDMEFAELVFEFKSKMLPTSLDKYFTKIANIHNYNIRKETRNEFYQSYKN